MHFLIFSLKVFAKTNVQLFLKYRNSQSICINTSGKKMLLLNKKYFIV